MSNITADELLATLPGATTERRIWLRQIVAEAKRRNMIRRERVLRYPDLAKLLTEPPLNYDRPDQWNGYVPPRDGAFADPEVLRSPLGEPNRHGKRTQHRGSYDSLARQALVKICSTARQRDVDAGLCDAEPEPDILSMFPYRGPVAQSAEPAYDSGILGDQAERDRDEQSSVNDDVDPDFQHAPMRGPGRQ